MEQILLSVFTAPVIIFCVMIYFATKIIRTAVELRFEDIKNKKYWRDICLTILPVVVGSLLAILFYGYPFPDAFTESTVTRGVLGSVCGGVSGTVYRIFKALFSNSLKKKNDGDNDDIEK